MPRVTRDLLMLEPSVSLSRQYCGSARSLADTRQTQKHTARRLSEDAVCWRKEKKAQDRSTDPLGGSCVSVFNGRDEAEDYFFIFKFPILPSCQVDQVYLADNFWRQVVLQGCLKSRNTKKNKTGSDENLPNPGCGLTVSYLTAAARRWARDDLCVLDGEDGVRSAAGVVVVGRRRDAVGDAFLQKIDGLLAACDNMLRQIWWEKEENSTAREEVWRSSRKALREIKFTMQTQTREAPECTCWRFTLANHSTGNNNDH